MISLPILFEANYPVMHGPTISKIHGPGDCATWWKDRDGNILLWLVGFTTKSRYREVKMKRRRGGIRDTYRSRRRRRSGRCTTVTCCIVKWTHCSCLLLFIISIDSHPFNGTHINTFHFMVVQPNSFIVCPSDCLWHCNSKRSYSYFFSRLLSHGQSSIGRRTYICDQFLRNQVDDLRSFSSSSFVYGSPFPILSRSCHLGLGHNAAIVLPFFASTSINHFFFISHLKNIHWMQFNCNWRPKRHK